MLFKRVAVLVAAAVMVLSMLVVSAPAFAQDEFPGQGSGATDPNPGQTEGSRSNHGTPPTQKPGSFHQSQQGLDHGGKNGTETGVCTQNLSECQ
jgi:hypothetical protein